jgi:enoyl-CoA hydratase/carnithine racemase
LDDAAEILVDLLRQPEAQEGIAAFFEKRPPAWAR